MGLNDLPGMDTPQKVGGRPPKEEEEDEYEKREAHGDPYTPEKDDEEWWRDIYDGYVDGDGIDPSEMALMAHHTHLHPWKVMEHLDEHDIHSWSDFDRPDDYPSEDLASSGGLGGLSGFGSKGLSSDDDDSGLSALID